MKLFSLTILLSFLLPIQSIYSSGINKSWKAIGDTIVLLNGHNLDNWYTFIKDRGVNNDPKQVFTINEEGFLRISGEEWGCITSEKEFENYKIIVEYKWGEKSFAPREEKARDSGLLIHSQGEDGAYSGTWIYSIECNIIEGGTGDFIVVADGREEFALTCLVAPEKQADAYQHHPYGSPVTIHRGRINWAFRDPEWNSEKGFRGKYDIENPAGEWNRLECVALGDEISIFLNGRLVNHAVHVSPNRGRIQLQSEGAEILFRKIVLVPLSSE